jgi:SpoVK/Ycf46/Vps4 family AAA+-type ATPase
MTDVITALREGLAFAPDNHPLRLHLARALLSAGRAEEALREFQQVARALPGSAEAHAGAFSAAAAREDTFTMAAHALAARAALSPAQLLAGARALLAAAGEADARALYEAARAGDDTLRDLSLERALRGVSLQIAPPPAGDAPAKEPPTRPARPAITFSEVGGLEPLKERLRMDIVYPLQRPDLFRAYGKKAGGGVLLYGPPGCGKTHLARAAAGECGASFHPVEIQQVLDMYLGESEKRLHAVFERARTEAPAIVFFDEVEAIGGARAQARGPARRLVNQLLTELDGVGAANEGVLVLGATNAPWDVDPALRRPGRFDRVVFVPPPDLAGREAVLRLAFRERPTGAIDYAELARRTPRWSGADLAHLAEAASERALAEALRAGALRPIAMEDVLAVLSGLRPTTTEWLATAKRYVTYANDAGQYDDIAAWLKTEG